MDLISVIVPVYKVEKYLDRCVQSIVDQTYRNLEIILVDDGSPDRCPAMCDAWAEKDSRIKVIHKENGGSAQARNVGLDYASGEYIGFVDSDDLVHPAMYRYLYEMIQKTQADIAECGYYRTEKDIFLREEVEEEVYIFNTEEALRENIRDQICLQILWNKLYKRETIGDIRMVEGKTIDDEFFTYRVLACANRVAVGKQIMYAYRQQPNSVMHVSFSMARIQALEAKCQRLDYLKERFPELVSQARVNLWYTSLFMGQMSLIYLNKKERKAAFEKMHMAQKKYSLTKADRSALPLKQRLWAYLSGVSFVGTCRLRNLLKIGI